MFHSRSNHRQNKRPQGADIKHILKYFENILIFILFYLILIFFFRVSLEDLYLGTTKTINIDRDVVCIDCKGYI